MSGPCQPYSPKTQPSETGTCQGGRSYVTGILKKNDSDGGGEDGDDLKDEYTSWQGVIGNTRTGLLTQLQTNIRAVKLSN